MPAVFAEMGPTIFPLLIIAAANLVLIVRAVAQLSGPHKPAESIEPGINAILFWGILALPLGYFGQLAGLYLGLNAVARAGVISPGLVALGLAESITSTMFGLLILIISAVAWFVLRGRCRKLSRAEKASNPREIAATA